MPYSDAYVQHLKRGPFSGRTDPWAEVGRYFHQIHSGMIDHILGQISDSLLAMGYIASRETSLQIAEGREPDVAVRSSTPVATAPGWDYAAAAESILVEPGIAVDWELPELDAIYITRMESDDLVTVVEIISPSNKTHEPGMAEYQERRKHLIRVRGVNVVEVDLTRSIKRMLPDLLATTYAYHIAIYLSPKPSRLLGMDFGEAIKPFALPLREKVLGVETQPAYDHAYRQASIAAQIRKEGHYAEDNLPFPSLLTTSQCREALRAVEEWQHELERLSKS